MTRVTILGKSQVEEPKKRIEFVKYLDVCFDIQDIHYSQIPDKWDNVVLLCKNYKDSGLDLMYAYNNNDAGRLLVVGHFNDGVV